MTDINRFSENKRKSGAHRIKTMEIFDLTDGQGEVTVTLTNKATINQRNNKSEAKQLKENAEKSPWTDERLGKSYANQSLSTRKIKDPTKALKIFTDSITRG